MVRGADVAEPLLQEPRGHVGLGAFYEHTSDYRRVALMPVQAADVNLATTTANVALEKGGELETISLNGKLYAIPLLRQILLELQVQTSILLQGLNVKETPENLRRDFKITTTDSDIGLE